MASKPDVNYSMDIIKPQPLPRESGDQEDSDDESMVQDLRCREEAASPYKMKKHRMEQI
jgi:hypothetical protein